MFKCKLMHLGSYLVGRCFGTYDKKDYCTAIALPLMNTANV